MSRILKPQPFHKSVAEFEAKQTETAGTRSGVKDMGDGRWAVDYQDRAVAAIMARSEAEDRARIARRAAPWTGRPVSTLRLEDDE